MTYLDIVSHYESCLAKHGDTHRGVDWPRKQDAATRYRIMLELIREPSKTCSILDFGCGAAHLFDYIVEQGMSSIDYTGLDISEKFIALCKEKYPCRPFYCLDFLTEDKVVPEVDYIIMNGVFTEKRSVEYGEMFAYFRSLLEKVFPLARKGLAFNVMSKQVDWERDDLFHLSLDEMASFTAKSLSRNFIVRNDYGLYEYTVYVYHDTTGVS